MKLEMFKAYDKIEREFVHGVMASMGFPDHFSDLVLKCISKISHQILNNWQPSKSFSP